MSDEERVIQAYRKVFSGPEAGVVLRDLAMKAHFFDPSFVNGNPEGMAYNEGARRIVLRIFRFSGVEEKLLTTLEEKHDRGEGESKSERCRSRRGRSERGWKSAAWKLVRRIARRSEGQRGGSELQG